MSSLSRPSLHVSLIDIAAQRPVGSGEANAAPNSPNKHDQDVGSRGRTQMALPQARRPCLRLHSLLDILGLSKRLNSLTVRGWTGLGTCRKVSGHHFVFAGCWPSSAPAYASSRSAPAAGLPLRRAFPPPHDVVRISGDTAPAIRLRVAAPKKDRVRAARRPGRECHGGMVGGFAANAREKHPRRTRRRAIEERPAWPSGPAARQLR
jgi:hypothetical protein